MTADFIQNQFVKNRTGKTVPKSKGFELTRDQGFVHDNQDIFDVLARQSLERNTLEQNIGLTFNVLERAKAMLAGAEKTLREQAEKLQILEDASGFDPLTGLLNRRGLVKILIREVARTNRGFNQGGLLVIFSLENLGAICAAHGDDAGDTALRLVAKALEVEIREMDYAARIGTDEFVLLFAETRMDHALSRLQDMALRLGRLSLITGGKEVRINLSLGLKSYGQGDSAQQIFKDANDDLTRNRKDDPSRS